MSYILEGLKKIEKNRHRGAAPDLFSDHHHQPPRDRKKWWPYVAALAVLLIVINVAGIYWWAQQTKTASKMGSTAHNQTAPDAASVAPEPMYEYDAKLIQESQKPLDPPLLQKQEDMAYAPEEKPAANVPDRVPERSTDMHTEQTPVREGETGNFSADKYPPLNKLPGEARSRVPEIKIFLHFYSADINERFVQINEHTLKEGQSRPDGLKVLKITRQAAFFSFKGQRFQMQAIDR